MTFVINGVAPLADGEKRNISILLVEDSATDTELAQKAFQRGGLDSTIHHVKDGVEAMAFLRRSEPYLEAVEPDIILLDLNLP